MKYVRLILILLVLLPVCFIAGIALIGFFGVPLIDEIQTRFAIRQNTANQFILNDETGYVYNFGPNGEFRRYNINDKKWETQNTHGYKLSGTWDMAGNIFAYQKNVIKRSGNDPSRWEIDKEASQLTLFKLPYFSVINTISGDYYGIKLDPTGKYVCVLKKIRSFIIKRGATTWGYPDECSMSIYSVESGKKISEFKEPILEPRLDWSPDSSKILFVKIKNRDLIPQLRTGAVSSPGVRDLILTEEPPRSIFVYDIQNNSTTEICQGYGPQWSHDGKKMLHVGGKVAIYSFESKKDESLNIKSFLVGGWSGELKWSPSDKNIITAFDNPFPGTQKLTIINLKNPKLKMIIDRNFPAGNYVWTK